MKKESLKVGDIVAIQIIKTEGPFRAKVIDLTNELNGIYLEIDYTATPFVVPENIFQTKAVNGKNVLGHWDRYIQSLQGERAFMERRREECLDEARGSLSDVREETHAVVGSEVKRSKVGFGQDRRMG